MIKLNKHGLISKRLIAPEFTVGNTFVEGGGTSEELAVLSLTNEQLAALSYIVNGEGRIIPVGEDGTFDTKIGHSYCIRHTDDLTLHEAWLSNDENLYVKRYGSGQLLFFATSEKCKINDPSYIVTEVFRMAALNDFVDWSGIEHYQKWFKEIKVELTDLLGSGDKFVLEIADENTLIVHTDRISDELMKSVTTLLERVLPQNIEVEHMNILPLPAGYKQVEYIQTQKYTGLATDFLPSNETEVYVDVIRINDTYYGRLCGNLGGGGTYNMYAIHHMNGTIAFDFGSSRTEIKTSSESDSGKRYTAKYGQSGVFINGVLVGDVPARPQFKATIPMYIFTVPQSEIGASGEYKAFRFTVYDAGEIVFDFIPTLDEVGAPCFYELESKVPYYNIGTLDFLYPTDSTTYALRHVLPDWGQLTPHGLRRLYHAPEDYTGELIDYALENGFKRIVEPEMPEEGYWSPQWHETDEEIVLEWIETEPPTDLESQN